MENIININRSHLTGNPQTCLKVNSILSKLGFKEVNLSNELRENHYCDELTLYISPQLNYDNRQSFYLSDDLKNNWGNKAGYRDVATFYSVINYDDETEKIMIDGTHFGNYYKNRNFIIFFYPIHYTKIEMGAKNEFLFYLLEKFSNEILRIKPKIVDVSKKIREELVNKFLTGIKRSLINFQGDINSRLITIEEVRTKELRYLSEVNQLKEQIKTLKGTYKTMGGDIELKIAEIKKLPFVRRVGISNLGIRVDFRHIDLEWEGNVIELGECYCYLNPNKLIIKNKNYVVYDGTTYHSPHITDDTVCFGSGKAKAYELLSSLKFKELVYFIYIYLKTYNEGDTYICLSNWEKCKDNGGEWDSSEEDYDE